ncbi:hypothetical protein H0E87_018418 [Populus deltoides]|uniref:Uncharacterized protein n=1 Tax=Populus deltoides TaxID=3696 RepID=A0A8T2XQV7_POPDE|nr:hypothetical protein H0E87_018418 [Populus deltoides]
MGAGELGELGPRGEGIGRGMGTVKLLNGGRFLLVNPWGEWEQGNWGTGTERRGNWEGNGNSEIVGGEWEQGNWGTGTERRGDWEGNGNSEIVEWGGDFLKLLNGGDFISESGEWDGNCGRGGNCWEISVSESGTVKLLNANGELYKPVITKL